MELCSPMIKKFLIFSQKSFSYFSGNETFLKKLFIFQEGIFQARKKKTHTHTHTHSEQISYVSGN